MIAARGNGGDMALDFLREVQGALDVVAPHVDLAVVGQGGGAFVGEGDVHHVALDLLGDVGEHRGGGGKGHHFPIVGQCHNDVGVVIKLGDVALHLAGDADVEQVGAAPVVEAAALRQGQGNLVAGGNLLDGLGRSLKLHGQDIQAHAVVAPGEQLAFLVDSQDVVQAGGDLGQLAHLRGGGNAL